MDGNKRAGLLAARTFLFLNGYHFSPTSEVETVRRIEDAATGSTDEEALAEWIAEHTERLPPEE